MTQFYTESKIERSIREFFIILTISVIPVLVAFIYGGEALLNEIVTGLLAHNWVIYYTGLGSAVFAGVAFLNWYLWFSNEVIVRLHNQISMVLLESASTFLGILRITSGVLISIFILWTMHDFNLDQLPKMSWLFLLGIIAFAEGVIISSWIDYAKINWLKAPKLAY